MDPAAAVAATEDWNIRVALIRKVPEYYGTAQHAAIYSRIAREPTFRCLHLILRTSTGQKTTS